MHVQIEPKKIKNQRNPKEKTHKQQHRYRERERDESETHSRTMNRVGSNEVFDIRGGPGGKGFITVGEPGIVFIERKSLAPELLVAFPVPPKERLR